MRLKVIWFTFILSQQVKYEWTGHTLESLQYLEIQKLME